jgi:hypothetical protein
VTVTHPLAWHKDQRTQRTQTAGRRRNLHLRTCSQESAHLATCNWLHGPRQGPFTSHRLAKTFCIHRLILVLTVGQVGQVASIRCRAAGQLGGPVACEESKSAGQRCGMSGWDLTPDYRLEGMSGSAGGECFSVLAVSCGSAAEP